jgi:hypothetical protein
MQVGGLTAAAVQIVIAGAIPPPAKQLVACSALQLVAAYRISLLAVGGGLFAGEEQAPAAGCCSGPGVCCRCLQVLVLLCREGLALQVAK